MENVSTKHSIRVMLTIPKNSISISNGGLAGQDYHIQSVDTEDSQLVTATLNDIKVADYSKTGATIDYDPTGIDPANTSVTVPAADIGQTADITFSKDDEDLEWKIWGEDRR